MSLAFLRWSYFGILLAFCLAAGLVWNLVILYIAAQAKIPISGTLERLTFIPWGISFFCLGVVLWFVIQMLVASVSNHDILFFDEKRAARRIAIALGYQVRVQNDEIADGDLIRRIREMSRGNG